MEIRFLGHASIYMRTDRVSVVTDPWFSEDGAFLASWFQFPDNTTLDLGFLRDVDYVVLSHEHQDHFDLPFLRTLSPATRIVIPKYTDSYLVDTLRENLPNEVLVCPALQPVELGDITLWPVVQSVPYWDDCTLVFETPQGTIIDVNDMKLGATDAAWITERFPDPELLFIQYSGATYYPYVYEMPEEKKAEISRKRRRSKFHGAAEVFRTLGPRYLVPCAGPAAFLDDATFELNFDPDSIFPTQEEFLTFAESEGFADRTVIALPGQHIDLDGDPTAGNGEALQDAAFGDRRAYLEAYRDRRRPLIAETLANLPGYEGSLLPRFQAFLEPLLGSSLFFRQKIGGAVLFEMTGANPERILVDFRRVRGACKVYEDEEYFYRLTIDGRIMRMYLDHELHFDQLLLSLRFRAHREPDVFNEYLFMFLRFADPASYEQIERHAIQTSFDERFQLEHEGSRYTVQRYCPHAMGDLTRGEIVDGCIVCPNHGWQFSLADGQARGQDRSIAVSRIDASDGPA
ncbi:MAG: MBL fold metallo-hydrolase [Tepidiformaceae bacterium]